MTGRARSRRLALTALAATTVMSTMTACADAPDASPLEPRTSTESMAGSAPGDIPAYEITDLPTLGGFFSVALGVNDAGHVGGSSNTTEEIARAFLWTGGPLTDIGSLGGNILAIGPNNRDEMAALAELPGADPDNQDLCGFGTHRICVAAYWRHGEWTRLQELPGPHGLNSVAVNLNDRGQAVGLAEIGVRDPSCAVATPFQMHEFVPVVWGPMPNDVQVLPLLQGDEVGFAYGINDHDEVVGSTGSCATTSVVGSGVLAGPHAVLWNHGVAIPLDARGSTNTISTAYSINNRGEVVGVSGATALHGFLWTRHDGMQSLGAVEGDAGSIANWINNRGQVVGASCPETPLCKPGADAPSRAFLRQHGVMMDLNALVVGEPTMYLLNALAMNDAGQIVGIGLTDDFELHAFLATPVSGLGHGQVSASRVAPRPKGLALGSRSR
jgi:probable HAF family extracellular repeat protein